MWIFTPIGFVSAVVINPKDAECLNVEKTLISLRARNKAHLNSMMEMKWFTRRDIYVIPHADYGARVYLTPAEFAAFMLALAEQVTYTNFKNEAHQREAMTLVDSAYVSKLHSVWGVMYQYQCGLNPPVPMDDTPLFPSDTGDDTAIFDAEVNTYVPQPKPKPKAKPPANPFFYLLKSKRQHQRKHPQGW